MNPGAADVPITLVAAMTEDRVIGRDNALPWHLPSDLKHFKRVTLGKPVIMGRRTWESVGAPLPGRRTIVVSRQPDYRATGAEVVPSLDAALRLVAGESEACIVGGAALYEEALPRAHRMELTHIHARGVDGDTYFPAWDPAEWTVVASEDHPADARHAWPMTFRTWERIR